MKHFLKTVLLFTVLAGLQSCELDPPEFNITATSLHIIVGQTITFSEDAESGTEANWLLDGSTTPTASGSTVTATYNTQGTFKVSVTVKNKDHSITKNISVTVESGTWLYQFPGGQDNNNATIGDFCCTGQTITVTNLGGKPLGYAYFYGWQGQAYNLPNGTSIAPNFEIYISGTSDLDGVAPRQTSTIFFADFDNVIGRVKTVQVGKLQYTVKILEISYPTGTPYADTHFNMGSLKVAVTVKWIP